MSVPVPVYTSASTLPHNTGSGSLSHVGPWGVRIWPRVIPLDRGTVLSNDFVPPASRPDAVHPAGPAGIGVDHDFGPVPLNRYGPDPCLGSRRPSRECGCFGSLVSPERGL